MPGPLSRLLLLAALAAAPLHAGGGPDEVALVVDGDSAASLAVANAWIAARDLDPGHVIVLRALPGPDRITVEEFRGRILLPVIAELARRGLDRQVQWLVYSADLPTAVDFAADEPLPLGPMVGTTGSLTGLTLLAPLVIARDPAYHLAVSPNPLYAATAAELRLRPDGLAPEAAAAWDRAGRQMQAKDYARAVATLAPAVASGHPGIGYDYACALARNGQADAAMAALAEAVRCGWNDAQHTRKDDDLTTLRSRPDFEALVARLEAEVVPPPPTPTWDRRLVRRADGTAALGPVAAGGWLSAMLAVTSGRGLSLHEAQRLLARARAADGSRPAGTVYLMRNGDVRSTTRQWAFRGVVAALGAMGAKAEIVDGVLPAGRGDVAGLVAGSPEFDWPGSGATVLPGAICEHLTSCGGMMGWGDTQTPLIAFLRAGAAGATGTVQEPYALQCKFPSPFIQVHYRRGATLAEAVMAGVGNPYQLLLVGDPLCAPWAEPPAWELATPELRDGRLRLAALPAAGGPRLAGVRVMVDGVEAWRGAPGQIELPSDGWAAGPHRIAVVGVAEGAVAAQRRESFTVDAGGGPALAAERSELPLDATVRLSWQVPAGVTAVLVHLGRDLVVQLGGRPVALNLPATVLGLGRSALQLEVRDPVGRVLARSRAVELRVGEPAPRPAVALPAEAIAGIRLQPADAKLAAVVADSGRSEGGWLGRLGEAASRQALTAEWWQETHGDDDLVQVQLIARRPGGLQVDGVPLPLAGGFGSAIVRLAPGWHRYRLALGAGDGPVAVRLGVAGTTPADLAACRCLPSGPAAAPAATPAPPP